MFFAPCANYESGALLRWPAPRLTVTTFDSESGIDVELVINLSSSAGPSGTIQWQQDDIAVFAESSGYQHVVIVSALDDGQRLAAEIMDVATKHFNLHPGAGSLTGRANTKRCCFLRFVGSRKGGSRANRHPFIDFSVVPRYRFAGATGSVHKLNACCAGFADLPLAGLSILE